ncbi:hypothetical protein Vretimale_14185 [Volvox reticuliferus]|uniref:PH domain-containing protein n=1 Tax=Volvox reticuliferus TaxID=1737510 RepID=A0A8J4LUH8_9CHLO|nr:hypothetical protein Vretifemale_15105 [Volvox reticuliferus]GIM10540.1 hypothetical protein Vretimale_14185 [Volvox reticuliferus]
MAPSKQTSPSTPGDASNSAGQPQLHNQGAAPAIAPSRSSLGGANPPQSSSPAALAETSSPVAHGVAHAAAPSSPQSLTKRSDSGGAGSGAGSAGHAAAPAGAGAFFGGVEPGQSGPHSGSNHQHKYGKRSSDSGGGSVGTGLGFRMSPPMPKGASISGAGPTLGTTGGQSSGSFLSQQSSHQGQQQAAQGFTGRRLQQLGQRLNFGLNLGRKKHATFAPGVTGGSGGGVGGGGGSGQVSCPEDFSTAGGSSSIGVAAIPHTGAASLPASFASAAVTTFGHGASAQSAGLNGGGGGGGGGGKLTAEEFNPPNHPVNPFSYLATPFRVMARTKAGAAMGRYATTALRLKRDGLPPASYMWLWLGNFKRWHRRYFVASEAPGVLLIYKRANMKGKVWSTSLSDATVAQDDSHPRQIRLVTPSGTIFLRVLRPEERQPWIACLRASQEMYRKHKEVVDTLTAAAGETGEAAGTVAVTLPSVASGAVEQDAEQRRRIRARLNDRWAELTPLVSEVERHLCLVSTHLAGAAAGIGHLSTPMAQYSSFSQLNNRGLRSPGPGDNHASAGAAAAAIPASPTAISFGAAAQAAAEGLTGPAGGQSVPSLAGASVGAGASPWKGEMHATMTATAAPACGSLLQLTASEVADIAAYDRAGALARSRSRTRAVLPSTALHCPTLAGAVTALVDAFRATLHNEAVRIATLEAENAALNKTVNILRANTHRNAGRTRGASTPGLSITSAMAHGGGTAAGGPQAAIRASGSTAAAAAAAAAAALAAQAAATATSGVMDDAASDSSACTADEDAFDVVESFDEGVDDDLPPYVQQGNYPGVADEEESDEDAEEDAAELAQQAEVLNALEVVRQVEYITANDNNAQLKTLLTADTPPPPDAEEDEEEAGKHKLKFRAKGEDTDVTLDDEDDDDSETGAGAGGAAATRRPYAGRSRLPAPKPLGRGFSIWSILKNMIGRDLTKITMPATINEPLSMTQRMAEVLENRSLLERACTTEDSVDRLMLVSCWLLAGYNSQPLRDNKPFNPLLGETFEWQAPDGSSRYLCEQVSHHPPVSCFVAEGAGPQGYELYGEVETKTKFWGKTIDCILAGHMSLKLKAFGEEYRFNLGTLVINDIILGRFWIDLSCDMKIRNQQTGDTSSLIIKPCRGYLHLKERGKCDGVVCDAEGREVWRISGSSMGTLFAALSPEAAAARGQDASTEPQLIWSKEPELPNPTEQYCMTRFALGLNDPADPVVPHLPPTDARFRPDMRALELGEWNRATSEKLRLEEKQRAVRRIRKEAGQEYQPRWFRQVLFNTKDATQPASQPGSVWEFTNEYWDARNRKDWGELPDIY